MKFFKKKKIIAVSGGFDPVHIGHVRMFQEAAQLADKLVVIINDDDWLMRKKGFVFMNEKERGEIIKEFECVDKVYVYHSPSGSNSVAGALRQIKPDIFANGGDKKTEEDIPESEVCNELGIKMIFNVGGRK